MHRLTTVSSLIQAIRGYLGVSDELRDSFAIRVEHEDNIRLTNQPQFVWQLR
jgi:hypothetical protein